MDQKGRALQCPTPTPSTCSAAKHNKSPEGRRCLVITVCASGQQIQCVTWMGCFNVFPCNSYSLCHLCCLIMSVAERTQCQTLCLAAHLLLSCPLIFNVTPPPVLFPRSFSLPPGRRSRLPSCLLHPLGGIHQLCGHNTVNNRA